MGTRAALLRVRSRRHSPQLGFSPQSGHLYRFRGSAAWGTGYCYAKSHLLAALLRANGIPAGLCYQRLSVDGEGAPFCLHGLNAVYLDGYGWYRIDARGNKPGVDAQFVPPVERLAFALELLGEADLPGIHAEPLPQVVDVLTRCATVQQVYEQLPDLRP